MKSHITACSRHKSYHGTSEPAITHVDAGFRRHQLEMQVASQSQHIKSSHSPCRRSIPQALVRDTHTHTRTHTHTHPRTHARTHARTHTHTRTRARTWHYCVLPESPLACWIDPIPQAPCRLSTSTGSRHTYVASLRFGGIPSWLIWINLVGVTYTPP